MEADPLDVAEDDDVTDLSGEQSWEDIVQAGSKGDWEAIGLDAPGAEQRQDWAPADIESFIGGEG